ncbi:MAG: hypothetical protein LAP38_00560 [Acidobacteriia bacterium]|nr:hypothetical protein [Terriglobia bacterium]
MRAVFVFIAASIAATGPAWAQPGVILSHNFENDTAAWSAMGPGAAVRVVREAGLNGSTGALSLTYQPGAGKIAGAVLPVSGQLARMQRIRFSVRSDHDTAVALLLSEKKPGGGDYTAWFWAPAGVWQPVELTPSDFTSNSGPNDAVDPDGKLDVDQVQGIALFDLASVFSSMPARPDFPVAVSRPAGSHTLLLSGFQVLASGAGERGAATRALAIDTFDRGFLEWITLGGMTLQLSAKANPLGMPALEAAYEQTEGRFALLVRRLSNLDLSKAGRLAFDIASERDAVLVVSLELSEARKSDGPRYNLTIFPPADRKPFHVNLRLADFEHDPNSPVAGPAHVDASRLKSLTITDVTAASGGDTGSNRIWIGNVQALPE